MHVCVCTCVYLYVYTTQQMDCFIPVAPVGERCDDETWRVAQVFVAIPDVCCDHTHNDVVFPVVAELSEPAEVMGTGDVVLGHLCHYVTRCTPNRQWFTETSQIITATGQIHCRLDYQSSTSKHSHTHTHTHTHTHKHTHSHTHTHTHTPPLSDACYFSMLKTKTNSEPVKQNNSRYVQPIADFVFGMC